MASRLLLLNGVAILNVILFHATEFGFIAMFSWAHRYRPVVSPNYDEAGTAAYYALRAIEQYVSFTIPAFLFVSGFFVSVLAGRAKAIGAQSIKARVSHLLIPYLFWSGVVLLALALQGRTYSPGRYTRMILTGATFPNYYFVPLLIQLYLVAPAIVALARWRWRGLLLVTALVQLAVTAAQYPIVVGVESPMVATLRMLLPQWFFGMYLFWFTFGTVAGFQQRALREHLARTKWIWLGATVALLVLGFVEWEMLLRLSGSPWRGNRGTLVDGLYAASAIMSFLAFADANWRSAGWLLALGGQSFGIYLVHGLAMEYFSRGVYHLAPALLGHQIAFIPLVVAVGLIVPLGLMAAIRRSRLRSVYGYLFG